MLPVLLWSAVTLADDAVVMPPTTSGRVWPDDPDGIPAIAEHYPDPPVALRAHAALHRMSLDGCWRQHAALGADLDLWFCADAKVNKKGRARVKMTALSDERPGLQTCIEATLESWSGPAGMPEEGPLCRAVATHISDAARAVWSHDPWAEVAGAGRGGEPAEGTELSVGRPAIERAVQLQRDPSTGDLVEEPAPLALRDRQVSTARRYLSQNLHLLAGCWADHGQWRPPPISEESAATFAYTLLVTVGETGPEAVQAGRATPATHRSVAVCTAARLDPGVGASEGSTVVEVPVSVTGVSAPSP